MMLSPVVPAYEFYKFVFLRAGAGCREGMTTVRQNVEGAGMHEIALGTLYFRTGINAATVVRDAGASNGEDRSWPYAESRRLGSAEDIHVQPCVERHNDGACFPQHGVVDPPQT
jgi:hypothetical protein